MFYHILSHFFLFFVTNIGEIYEGKLKNYNKPENSVSRHRILFIFSAEGYNHSEQHKFTRRPRSDSSGVFYIGDIPLRTVTVYR